MSRIRVRGDIHAAARSGDLSTLESILASNPLAVNSRDKHSRTPLHLAAWSGQAQVVSYLCKQKADVGAAAMDDMGAIHFAAQKGHLEVVRTLLSSGVSVKAANRKGFTPLHYAVQGSHLEVIKVLLKKGASLSAKTKAGKTPLDLAVSEEIRSYLKECEQSPMEANVKGKEKIEKRDSRAPLLDKTQNSDEATAAEQEQQEDERVKRKGDDDNLEALSEPKKPRVVLKHLLSADDTQEDEETS
ncbi:ankyrin-3 [Durio zibethinus]|uniref:Ankyrin-3 n=1 Tax=Durio zibethinus TaxID=66656 RepID=A0A6P5ZEW5_DURZI|nr:ankyrin-3 [Durio zibethinus]